MMTDSTSTYEQLYNEKVKECTKLEEKVTQLRNRHKQCNTAYWETKALFQKEEAETARLRLESKALKQRHKILWQNYSSMIDMHDKEKESSKSWYAAWQVAVKEQERQNKEIDDLKQQIESLNDEIGLLVNVREEADELKRQLNNAWESNRRLREYCAVRTVIDVTADHQQMINVLNGIRSILSTIEEDVGYQAPLLLEVCSDILEGVEKALDPDRPTNFVSAESAADNSMDAEEQKRKAATHLLRRIDYWRKIAVQRGNAIEEKDERILALEYFVNAANPLINGLYAQLLSEAILGDPELGHVQAHLRLHATKQMIKQIEDFRQTGIDIV